MSNYLAIGPAGGAPAVPVGPYGGDQQFSTVRTLYSGARVSCPAIKRQGNLSFTANQSGIGVESPERIVVRGEVRPVMLESKPHVSRPSLIKTVTVSPLSVRGGPRTSLFATQTGGGSIRVQTLVVKVNVTNPRVATNSEPPSNIISNILERVEPLFTFDTFTHVG